MARVRALRRRVRPAPPAPRIKRASTCARPIQTLNDHYVVRILRDDRLNASSPALKRASQLLSQVPRSVRKGCVKCQTHKDHAQAAILRQARRALIGLPDEKLQIIKSSLGLTGDVKIEVYFPGTQRNPLRTRIIR